MYGQTPKLESRSLILPRSAPWLDDFIEEYLAFPQGKYDDQIDALSQFLEWRVNRESAVFEFDFGYDDDIAGPRRSWTSSLASSRIILQLQISRGAKS